MILITSLTSVVSCVYLHCTRSPDSDGYSAGTERAMLDSIGVWDIELGFGARFYTYQGRKIKACSCQQSGHALLAAFLPC